MVRILHFSDAHIDAANYGRQDPETGLPVRVGDFLKALDQIIDTATYEDIDLVLFTGDAYKSRNPSPVYKTEWQKRIMRLSKANVPILLLVGNHDLGRASTLSEFSTLDVPYVHVADKPQFYRSNSLSGVKVQVIALPWITRSALVSYRDTTTLIDAELELGESLESLAINWMALADPDIPLILAAHAAAEGAFYGSERQVTFGNDIILSKAFVENPRLDYVALGHIHKGQTLHVNMPPVIYPGSIERVDWGEAGELKYFVIADMDGTQTDIEWRKIQNLRPFLEASVTIKDKENITGSLKAALDDCGDLDGAMVRLIVEYPRELDVLIDEPSLREHAAKALEFRLVRRPFAEVRSRIPDSQSLSILGPRELLDLYWNLNQMPADEAAELNRLAGEIIKECHDTN